MKKLLSTILLGFTALFLVSTNAFTVKAEEIVDLYPNMNEDLLSEPGSIPGFTSYGNANWVLELNGRRFNTIQRAVRFLSNLKDLPETDVAEINADDLKNSALTLWAPAIGGVIVNDTDKEITIKTADERADINNMMNRFWIYIDEEGYPVMYEDHFINTHYITKVEGEDFYRLSTEEEIKAFEAAADDAKPENMLHTNIRIKMNEDKKGYKAEPVKGLKWVSAEYDKYVVDLKAWESWEPGEGETEADKPEKPVEVPMSRVVEGNPNNVVIPAGWKVVHLSEWNRNEATINWAKDVPQLIADRKVKAEFEYVDPAPVFVGLEKLDQDDIAEGVNIVFEYNSEPTIKDLIKGVSVQYVDEDDSIAKKSKKTDFEIDIVRDGKVLETIKVVYNAEENKYEESAEITKVDTSEFGAGYELVYRTVSPVNEELVVEEIATLGVGVLSPKIHGVEDKLIEQDEYINLLQGITADDSYGKDLTHTLEVEHDKGFNPNNAKPGVYNVAVTASYRYFLDSELVFSFPESEEKVTLKGEGKDINLPIYRAELTLYTKIVDVLIKDNGDAWGRVTIITDSTGKVKALSNRFDGKNIGSDGEVTDAKFNDWLKANFEDGDLILRAHGGTAAAETRKLKHGDQLTIHEFNNVVDEIVSATRKFKVTVQDTEDPEIIVLNDTLVITTDSGFKDAEAAALSNIIVRDNVKVANVVIQNANRIDITEAGEYTINVIVSDTSARTSRASFKLIVKEGAASKEDLQDGLDEILENTLTKDEVQKLLDAKKSGTPIWLTIVVALVAAGLSFGGAVLFLNKKE